MGEGELGHFQLHTGVVRLIWKFTGSTLHSSRGSFRSIPFASTFFSANAECICMKSVMKTFEFWAWGKLICPQRERTIIPSSYWWAWSQSLGLGWDFVVVVVVVKRHVLWHDGHDLWVHVRLQEDRLSFCCSKARIEETGIWIWWMQFLRHYPEPVFVEYITSYTSTHQSS